MGKAGKASRAEVAELQVQHEQAWAYQCTLEHLSYKDMRRRANQSPADGGLGYDLSEHALKGLVKGYLVRMREVHAVDRDEQIARELNDLDLVQRLALASLKRAAELETLDVHAAKLFVDTGAQRRKLLGLDAPVESKVEVTMHDEVQAELNDMLARAGHPPIKATEKG